MRGSWILNRTATYWLPLLWPQQSFFPVLLGCSTGGLRAQPLWDMFLNPASSSNWSDLQLLTRESWGPTLLGATSLYSIFSPTALNFQFTELYNCSTPTFYLWASQIALIQFVHGHDYILIFLDRMHQLFTLVHFLFWQLGRVGGQYTTVATHYHAV